MSVASGVLPYQYIDIPFTFLGRFGNPSVGWSDQAQPIPEISGFLYEQAMYVHLAEIRKYGIESDPTFYNYRSAIPTEVAKQEVADPDPSGAFVSASGNPYCLNYIEDLRNSMDQIFTSVAWDTDSTQHIARTDYLRTSFSPLPSGASGDYQYRLPEKVLDFGSIFGDNAVSASGIIGASGYMDTQTIREISYQPYARFSRRGERFAFNVTYETAPVFPALITPGGDSYTAGPDVGDMNAFNYGELGAPQSSGFSPAVLASGVMRLCGDGFSETTQLRIISEENDPLTAVAAGERWIGDWADRNTQIPAASGHPRTVGMAFMNFVAQSPELLHGVHRIIVSDSNTGYGPSGVLSVYPNSEDDYHVTGWLSGIVAMNEDDTYSIVRNSTSGEPQESYALVDNGYSVTPQRSKGIHICDELFGGRNSSGVLNISPFNGAALLLSPVRNDNLGGTGAQTSAYFTTQPPPGITYVWRQSYDTPSLYWRNAGEMIQEEGSSTAFAFVKNQWSFRSYSSQQLPPAPDPSTDTGATAGLGQTTEYHFLKVNLNTRAVERSQVGFNHIGNHGSYAINGIAWSRNYGWFGVGGRSLDSHQFEAFRIVGDPDGGTFYESSAGGTEIVQPIGIGSKSFARRAVDVAAGVFSFWELRLGTSHNFNLVLLNQYTVTGDSNIIPFDVADINNFIGHTMFVGSNDEGITEGDWLVVGLDDGRRFLCRAELDTGSFEIQLVECLYQILQSSASPEVFMNV